MDTLKAICDANLGLGIALANLQNSKAVDRKVIESLPWLFSEQKRKVFNLNAIIERGIQIAAQDNDGADWYHDYILEPILDDLCIPWLELINTQVDKLRGEKDVSMPDDIIEIRSKLDTGSTIQYKGNDYLVIYGCTDYIHIAPKNLMIYNEPKKSLNPCPGYTEAEIAEITNRAKFRHAAISGRLSLDEIKAGQFLDD